MSKWENGGAPDVELLPALADRLGVSVDALFGRQEREVQDMGSLLGRWLRSQPGSRRLQALFELLFSNLYNLGLPLDCLLYTSTGRRAGRAGWKSRRRSPR